MNGMRKFFALVAAALMLAAFALPGFAASGNNKVYTLNMTSSLPTNATGQSMTADFANVSPDGNSTFKSLKLFAPPGITITAVTVPAGFTATPTIRNAAGAIVAQGTAVWVDFINLPVKPLGPHFILGLTVNTSCTGGGAWTTIAAAKDQVWSGTGWSGQNFAYSGGSLETTLTGSGLCSMSISGPTSALVGDATPTNNFTMTVNLNGGPGGNVTLSSNSECGFTGDGTTLASGGTASFTGYVDHPATCTFNASAGAAYLAAPPYTLTVYKGVIDCGGYDSSAADGSLDPNLDGPFVGTPGWGLRRGPNTDGAACIKVNYTCNLTLGNIASCSYDKSTGQNASFKYVFLWNPVSPISIGSETGWTNYRPQISWGIANPNPDTTSADWVPGLACVADDFPPLIPTPTAAQMLAVMPTIPDVAPFSGNPYPQYKYVASPLNHALVCIGQHGWTSVGDPPNSIPIMIQYYDKVLDEVDVLVKGPTS